MVWSPPRTGGLEVLDLGPRARSRLRTYLDLSGIAHTAASSTSVQRSGPSGFGTCIDTTGLEDDARLGAAADRTSGLTFGLSAAPSPLPLFGAPQTPLQLVYGLESLGSVADEPAPTHCGGPLPSDFLPSLPTQRLPLTRLRRGATTINLSGVAAFAAGGLAGTVRSSIVLRLRRLRGRAVPTQPRPTPRSEEDRVITVKYRVAKVAGSVGLNVLSDPSTCAGFDVCGLDGTVMVRPGPGTGVAYVIAHDLASISGARLRRAAGLAPGKIPRYAQASGLATWTSRTGKISATLNRGSSLACRDVVPLTVGALEIEITGKRAKATVGGDYAEVRPTRDLLRTRCPGPTASDVLARNNALATISLPVTALARPTITLHLTRGATVRAPGFTWRSHPALTIVLQRTGVTEQLVPSSAFET